MVHLTTAIVAAKVLTLTLGGAITFFAYRAYGRTGAPALRALAVGFGIVTVGVIVAGLVDQLTPLDFLVGILIESLLTLAGFSVIVYSLYVE